MLYILRGIDPFSISKDSTIIRFKYHNEMISYLEKWLDNKLEGYSNSITMNRFIKKNEIDNYLNLFKKNNEICFYGYYSLRHSEPCEYVWELL